MDNAGKPCLVFIHSDANKFYYMGSYPGSLTFPTGICYGIVFQEDNDHLYLKSFRGCRDGSVVYGFIDRFVKDDIDWFYLDESLNFILKGKEI
jgi:hypothetical protein